MLLFDNGTTNINRQIERACRSRRAGLAPQ
jgi:hypothetical protein